MTSSQERFKQPLSTSDRDPRYTGQWGTPEVLDLFAEWDGIYGGEGGVRSKYQEKMWELLDSMSEGIGRLDNGGRPRPVELETAQRDAVAALKDLFYDDELTLAVRIGAGVDQGRDSYGFPNQIGYTLELTLVNRWTGVPLASGLWDAGLPVGVIDFEGGLVPGGNTGILSEEQLRLVQQQAFAQAKLGVLVR